MDRKDVDSALARLRADKQRITDGLLELEADPNYRLLGGARLSGATERSWTELRGTVQTLWTLLGGYDRVLHDAEQVRARKARPGRDELIELTGLLTGVSVELVPGEVPLERRSLLGPQSERLTLDAVVERMIPLYEEVARTVSAVGAVWAALLSPLAELEDASREVAAMLDALGRLGPAGAGAGAGAGARAGAGAGADGDGDAGAADDAGNADDAEFDRLRRELGEVREAVHADPLSFVAGDPKVAVGGADMTRLDRLAAGFRALRARLAPAVRIRAEHNERVRRIDEAIRQVAAAEAGARTARDLVLAKIDSPGLPDVPDVAGALRDRLAALGLLRAKGRWLELARLAEELEKAAEDAYAQARDLAATISGLLDRRNELRGRLEAYKARAGRLGRAEDAELGRLYRRAHDLLWTAPCDLREATAAVASYQWAIRGAGDD